MATVQVASGLDFSVFRMNGAHEICLAHRAQGLKKPALPDLASIEFGPPDDLWLRTFSGIGNLSLLLLAF